MYENKRINIVINNFNRLIISLYIFFYLKNRYILIIANREKIIFSKKMVFILVFKKKAVSLQCEF